MESTVQQKIFNLLAEMQDLLAQATCDGEKFEDSLQQENSWAAEINDALTTLTDSIEYYVD